jgi:hypothetical protein
MSFSRDLEKVEVAVQNVVFVQNCAGDPGNKEYSSSTSCIRVFSVK